RAPFWRHNRAGPGGKNDVARPDFPAVYVQSADAEEAGTSGNCSMAKPIGDFQRAGDKVIAQPPYAPERSSDIDRKAAVAPDAKLVKILAAVKSIGCFNQR